MQRDELNRRDFHKLTMAAFGGLVAGTSAGCAKPADQPPAPESGSATGATAAPAAGPDNEQVAAGATEPAAAEPGPLMLSGPNVCRGLNHTCANHKGGTNACAGQGSCHLAAAHTCHYENECRGQGGCGESPGQNECKGKGNCAVPLGDSAWDKARAAFEKAMTEAGKKFGDAPPAS